MNDIIAFLNSSFSALLDFILMPMRQLPDVWSLVFISTLAGIALLYGFGRISNQAAIRRTKDKIYAALLETALYRHDIRLCMRAQGRMLKNAGVYFLLALVPLAILSVPCVYLLGHLNARYNSRPLIAGETTTIGVEAASAQTIQDLSLTPSPGVETDAIVRVPAHKQIVFRVKAIKDGDYQIKVTNPKTGLAYDKPLFVGSTHASLQPQSYASWWHSLLYPGGEIVGHAKSDMVSVWIKYPEGEHSLLGMRMHWLLIFFIVSLVSGLVASRFLGIEI